MVDLSHYASGFALSVSPRSTVHKQEAYKSMFGEGFYCPSELDAHKQLFSSMYASYTNKFPIGTQLLNLY